jgi:hypothetical protein
MKTLRQLAELVILFAISIMFWYAATAGAQYGNPYDPYLQYQRHQRERESLELQRRQVEIMERNQIWIWTAPIPQIVTPWDLELQANPL